MRRRRHPLLLAMGLWLLAPAALAQNRDEAGARPARADHAAPAAHTDRAENAGRGDREARPRHARRERERERERPSSVSMGYANSGRLENAERLREDETLRYVPGRVLHYGTNELLGLIRRAARTVYRQHHVRLGVGDLSASHGGPVGHHLSHQSGRDADLGFYVLNRRGESVALENYVAFLGDGTSRDGLPLRFDTARNWALVEALLHDPVVHVEHIFVSTPLRALLLSYARAHGESPALIARASAVLHQPLTGNPHADHFHVRIGCPGDDPQCREGVRLPPRPRPRRARAHSQPADHHHHHHPAERASR